MLTKTVTVAVALPAIPALGAIATEEPDGTLRIGKGALRDALFATAGYAGATGTLTCTATGACAAPGIAVFSGSALICSFDTTCSTCT